jgi:hypothetical protein
VTVAVALLLAHPRYCGDGLLAGVELRTLI